MKIVAVVVSVFSIAAAARADFSYTTTRKTTGGAMAAMAGGGANGTSKTYLKGQKIKTEDGATSVLIDFDAQTITTINNTQKTITVRNFGDAAAGEANADIKIDAKETGQRKTVNGFDAKELVLTMEAEMAQGRGAAGKMQVEVDMWISQGVPGSQELRAFYQKNASRFPWGAIAGGGNQSLQTAMAEVQKKIASMDGVAVEQIIRVKPLAGGAGMPAMPQMTGAQAAQMDQARARLEAMRAQGGPGAAMAEQALARMGAMTGGAAGGNSAALIEITADSADFSTAAVADSVFSIPEGYTKTGGK
jgi:hypothetical protein